MGWGDGGELSGWGEVINAEGPTSSFATVTFILPSD